MALKVGLSGLWHCPAVLPSLLLQDQPIHHPWGWRKGGQCGVCYVDKHVRREGVVNPVHVWRGSECASWCSFPKDAFLFENGAAVLTRESYFREMCWLMHYGVIIVHCSYHCHSMQSLKGATTVEYRTE